MDTIAIYKGLLKYAKYFFLLFLFILCKLSLSANHQMMLQQRKRLSLQETERKKWSTFNSSPPK